mmetsp:Transcript_33162/g.79967  ORF Transcript_33162/g.79967 Transcript_33162/m.79967 type:complete len:428 (+) Transcript_33162:854-2137(+)
MVRDIQQVGPHTCGVHDPDQEQTKRQRGDNHHVHLRRDLQVRPLVLDEVHHVGLQGLHEGEGGVQTQQQQHEEEAHREEGGASAREQGQHFSEHIERQTSSCRGHLLHRQSALLSQIPNNREHRETSENRESRVAADDHQIVLQDPVVGPLVIGRHGDRGSHGRGQGEEDLGGGCAPCVRLGEVAHVRGDVVRHAITSTLQGHCLAEDDDQQQHGEQDSEISDLAENVLATDQCQPSHEPHRHQCQEKLPLHVPTTLIPKARRVQHGLPEVVPRRAPPTLIRVPRQLGSKGLHEVDHRPPEQRLVVGEDHAGHDDGHVGHPSPRGVHVREGTDWPKLILMAQHSLEYEQRSRDAEQRDQIRDHEGSSAVLPAHVRKSPDVPQPDGVPHQHHDELSTRPPLRALAGCRHLLPHLHANILRCRSSNSHD